MTGTNFSSWYNQTQGTFVADFDTLVTASFAAVLEALPSSGLTNRIDVGTGSIQLRGTVVVGGVTQADLGITGVPTANAVVRGAVAYLANDFAASLNGGTVLQDVSGTVPTVVKLDIGSRNADNYLNGHIRQIAYYNTRLSNTQLQQLTAPPLVTTLSLDFINGVYNA